MGLFNRLQHGWNAFMNKDPTPIVHTTIGNGSYYRPDRPRFTRGNERSIITALFNRIAIDVAAVEIKHIKTDENGKYIADMQSGLNDCLTIEANIDQTARAFIQDVVMSMLDEGCVAIVPVDTTLNPNVTGSYDVQSMRTGRIIKWYPRHVTVNIYNDKTGEREDVTLPKSVVGIVENPLYAIVNEPNATVKRVIRKLNILDVIDEQSGSGKLDLVIQLPYIVKGEIKRQQAEERRIALEKQLNGSKLGIGYIDGAEKVTQLNRPLENNLLKQIEYLMNMAYSQLGITTSILDGTADEKTMLNYMSRTIEPILSAIVDEMKRKFITKTARTQGQSIFMFKDPFKLVPVSEIAEISDKFTRNEIATSNEIRQVIGWKPSSDPKADELRNSNINQASEENQIDKMIKKSLPDEETHYTEEENQNEI